MDKEQFIINELDANNIEWEEYKDNFKLYCPFHEHSHRKKHLQILKDGSKANCFACSWSGSWNSFAKAIGLNPFNKTIQPTFNSITKMLLKNIPEYNPIIIPDTSEWKGDLFRFGNGEDISENIILKYGGRLWFDEYFYRCYFPCLINGKIKGYFGLRTTENNQLKQRNMDGSWVNEIFFGLQFITNKAVIVEGPTDVLRLAMYGINAIAILGNHWTPKKVSLLLSIGIKKILLAMDGDTAGDNYVQKIKTDLNQFMKIKYFDFPREIDPANSPKNLILLMKKIYDNM